MELRNKICSFKHFKLYFIIIFVAYLFSNISAVEVPYDLQAKLMLKILTMDRNFFRFGDPIKIGTNQEKIYNELKKLEEKLTVEGRSFLVEKIGDPKDILNFKVVYVGKKWDKFCKEIQENAINNKCLIFCETQQGVKSGAGAVSFKVLEKRAKIMINLKNSRIQGTDFPAGFLNIAEIVDMSK